MSAGIDPDSSPEAFYDAEAEAAHLAARVLGIDPAGIVEHIAAGGTVRPPVPGGTSDTYRPPTGDLPVGWQQAAIDGARQLHVRAYAAGVAQVAARLATIAPFDGPFGLLNAATALEIASTAIDHARLFTRPHRPSREAGQAVRPTEVAVLISHIGTLAEELAHLIGQVSQQLANMHSDAIAGKVVGPPSSTAHAEVEKVIRDILNTDRSVTDMIRYLEIARARVLRLNVTPGSQVPN